MYKPASVLTYTFSHFCVDFACFFMLFYSLFRQDYAICVVTIGFLLYNVIAFGLQPIIGYICDIKKHIPAGLIGCLTVLAGILLIELPWASLILCALGNACFHVGGGIDSLVYSNGKMFRSGLFVSSGALGVVLGTIYGKGESITIVIPVIMLALCCLLIIFFAPVRKPDYKALRFSNTSVTLSFAFVLLLCFVSIVIRSYVGSITPIVWKTTIFLTVLPAIGACIGKASGGFLADIFGAKNVGVVTLFASIPFLLFGSSQVVPCMIGIILFNMTMPITLCAIANKLPDNPGLAFGATTLCLLCGNMPTFFYSLPGTLVKPVTAILILISAACIYYSIKNQKGGLIYEKTVQKAESHSV